MSRFYFVENLIKIRDIQKIPGYENWPSNKDKEDIERHKSVLIRLLENRDRLWDCGRNCTEKTQAKIYEYDKWLRDRGVIQMEDMPPEFSQVISEHFWELLA